MNRFVVAENLLTEVINYLAGRPFREVSNLIGTLANSPTFEQEIARREATSANEKKAEESEN